MTYRDFLCRNSLWFCCIAFSTLLFILIVLYLPVPLPKEPRSMMFTITQVLATIIALVIPIPLIAAQFSTTYSINALDVIFSKKTTIYFIWLIFSATYPLLVAGNLSTYTTRVAIGLVNSCFILLMPYFYEVKERLKPINLLRDLGNKTTREIKTRLIKIMPLIREADQHHAAANRHGRGGKEG